MRGLGFGVANKSLAASGPSACESKPKGSNQINMRGLGFEPR